MITLLATQCQHLHAHADPEQRPPTGGECQHIVTQARCFQGAHAGVERPDPRQDQPRCSPNRITVGDDFAGTRNLRSI